ncbi:MAG: S9 family peptidase [Paludibacteraceae bacterium]|nr:S9 family peptidase [Paludibacteraceae bacterium]
MKKTFLTTILCVATLFAHAELLEDLIGGRYNAKNLPRITHLSDGEHYAIKDGNCILSYNYKGELTDTLFNIEKTKLLKLDTIQGFVLSQNPRWLLVYNERQQIYRRSFEAKYYIYDTERKELKVLNNGRPARDPLFSPNGRYIAFAFQNNLYIHKLDFGTEIAITQNGKEGEVINGTADWLYEEEFSTTSLMTWSADSKSLAFVRLNETNVPQFTYQTMLEQGYPQSNTFKYPRAGEENATASVIVYDTQYKSLKKIELDIAENSYIPRLIWTNNAELFAIFTLNRNQNKIEMFIANAKSTVSKLINSEESKTEFVDYANIDNFSFLENNDFILVSEKDGYRHAYLYDANGILIKQITKGKYDITKVYGYDAKSQTLYYQAAKNSPTQRQIYANKKGKEVCIASEEGMHNASFSKNLQHFIDSYSSVTSAPRVEIRNNQGKTIKILADNTELENDFKSLHLPQKQFTSIITSRGDTLFGWILYPTDFKESRKYPLLQIQYSGPASQQALNRWKKDWEYFLADKGYVVVCFDGRGTDARGRKFRNETYMNLGTKEAQDQVAVAQYFGTMPYIDSKKIAIWGWSYGGFNTIMAMSQPEKVFCAGIAVAPVTNFRLYDSAYTERYMRRPQENDEGYEQTDAAHLAQQLNGRLLIVHGSADDNVHFQNTMQYVEALIDAEKQFDMQIYPDDNHFMRKGKHYKHLYHKMFDFLEQYVK